jgi:hypothetical protein
MGAFGKRVLEEGVLVQPSGHPLLAGHRRLKQLHIHIDPNDVMPAAQGADAVIGVCEPGLKLGLRWQAMLIRGMSKQVGNPTAI